MALYFHSQNITITLRNGLCMETEIDITSMFTWLRVTQIAIWDERKTEEEMGWAYLWTKWLMSI